MPGFENWSCHRSFDLLRFPLLPFRLLRTSSLEGEKLEVSQLYREEKRESQTEL